MTTIDVQTEFSDGGIDLVIEKEFVSKLMGLAELDEREILVVTSCVMGSTPQSHLAKDLGVSPVRVGQIIAKSIRKIKYAFIKHRDQVVGRSHNMIVYESTASFEERLKAEKAKNAKEKTVVDSNGTTYWYRGNLLHREGAPAVVQSNGGQAWFYYGSRHREDGPAIEFADGSKEWWLHGKRHRQIGYAVEHANGTRQKWLYNNKIYEETIK